MESSFSLTYGHLMQSIFKDSPDAVFLADPETCAISDYNARAVRFFEAGSDKEAMCSRLQAWLREYYKDAPRAGAAPKQFEVAFETVGGNAVQGRVTLREIDVLGTPRLLIRITDTTEKQAIEDRLRLSGHILEAVDHLILVADGNANIIYISPSVKDILGYEPDELLGRAWWKIFSQTSDKLEEELSYIRDAVGEGTEVRGQAYERSYFDKSGKEQWILWRDSKTEDGLVIGVGILYTKSRKDRIVRSAILNIADASSRAKTPTDFYREIHREIMRVINTPNFYIAVFDEERDEISFPYYADSEDLASMKRAKKSRKAGHGLTEYAIRSRIPVRVTKSGIGDLMKEGEVSFAAKEVVFPEVWLGVPMLHEDKVVGVITIQDYHDPEAYNAEDLELVGFIAAQVGQYVAKLQTDEALRISEVQFRSIFDQAAVGIARISPDGAILQVNQQMETIFGYRRNELVGMSPLDLTHPEDVHIGMEELKLVLKGEITKYTKEKRYLHKNGQTIYALLNVSSHRESDRVKFIISVYEDISEKRRAQEETRLLLELSNVLTGIENESIALGMGMEQIAELVDWDYAETWVEQSEGVYQILEVAYAHEPELREFHRAGCEEGPFRVFIQQDLSQDLYSGPVREHIHSPRLDVAKAFGFKSAAVLPVKTEARVPAVLCFFNREIVEVTHKTVDLMNAVTAQLSTFMLRSEAERARMESEERYRAITEAAFEGIAIHRGPEILQSNTAFAEIFGYAPHEILNLTLETLVYEENPSEWLNSIMERESSAMEITGRKQDGQAIFLEVVSRRDQWNGEEARILAVRDITNQKLVEEAREAARIDARFRAYIQNSSEIITIIDRHGHTTYSSPSLKRIAGINPEGLMGTPYIEQFHPDDHEAVEALRKELLQTPGASQVLQAKYRCSAEKGDWLIVQAAFTNLSDDPLVRGVLISCRDITDIIHAQHSMRESEERFRNLFDQSPDAIFVESRDGFVLDANEAACKLLERTRDEVIGLHIGEMVPVEIRSEVVTYFPRWFTGEENYLESQALSKSGKVTPVEIRSSVIHYHNDDALILQVRDITERKQSELVLKESEERFRALVEHATEAIFVLDMDQNRFVEVNKNAENLFRRSRKNLMEIEPTALSPAMQPDGTESVPALLTLLGRALEGEQVVFEWYHVDPEGEEIPCEVRLNRFPSARSKLIRGSITDITERKLAELRMVERQEKLHLQNEKLIELAASNALNSGDLDAAFQELTIAMTELLDVRWSGIWLISEDGEVLVCHTCHDSETDTIEKGRTLQAGDYPTYFRAMSEERVIAVMHAWTDKRTKEFADSYLIPQNIKSVLDAPFRHNGRVAGVIWNESYEVVRDWSPESESFVASMADMVTLSLEAWERKKAEEELANTLSKMTATFESTRDGILVVDTDGRVLEYNSGFSEMSGIPADILDSGLPNPGFDIMLAKITEPERFMEIVEALEDNPDDDHRHIVTFKDGRIVELYARAMTVGKVMKGRLWFLHDITDLKRAEAALSENEARYRGLFAQANDAILVIEGNRIIECNDMAVKMFGLSREGLVGMAPSELSPEAQPDKVSSSEKMMTLIRQAMQGDYQFFYWKHRRADGTPFDAEVSLNSITVGERQFIQALVRDISKRVKADKALRESERKNKAILDAIPDLMIRISEQGRVLDYKTSDQQGLLPGEETVVGRNITEILPDVMAENLLMHVASALETGEARRYESELDIDGVARDYETRLVRSGPREALVIIRDITERKRTEKELRKRNFELDSFVYRASHDLKAPLNSLMGLINLVESETEDTAVLRYLGMMNKSVVKLDAFIRDLADFSRNARQEVEKSEILWDNLLQETMDDLNFMQNADRVEKKIVVHPGPPFYSDPVRIGILFNNLVSNAIKYQNLGRDDAEVVVEIENDAEKARIRIADNGIGISKEYHEKVFHLFFRASIQSYGSGMGMYIVKNAVDKLGGEIGITSEEGAGTTFYITIPNYGPTEVD